jgi:hypothetical protein
MIITEPWQSSHPLCGPQFEEFGDGSNDPFSRMLKQQLTDIIRWADKESARSKQVKIGPSEIGDPCDRRIGYRIAEVPEVNDAFDPWAAIVGTAVHSWLDGAVQDWMAATGVPDWKTETTLSINNFIEGHSDLYSVSHAAVIDWKTAGPTVMKKVVKGGPSDGYILQTQIYGYGFERAGIPVNKVCLVFLPRAGRLQDMYVWSADYNREVAQGAIKRLYEIARRVVSLETSIHPHRWEQVPATPSNACGFCSWYNSMKNPDEGADERGCPGR